MEGRRGVIISEAFGFWVVGTNALCTFEKSDNFDAITMLEVKFHQILF